MIDTRLSVIDSSQVPATDEWVTLVKMANALARARGFVPSHFLTDPAAAPYKILAALLYGRELKIGMMTSLQGIAPIEGKPSMSAQLIGALIRRAGHQLEEEVDDKGAKVTIVRTDGTRHSGSFSMADAQRAGLIRAGGGWQKYPQDMCYARALTQAARRGAQDVLAGVVYTPEELGADPELAVPAVASATPPEAIPEDAPEVLSGEILPADAAPESIAAMVEAQAPPMQAPPQEQRQRRSASPRRTNVQTITPAAAAPAPEEEQPPIPEPDGDYEADQPPISLMDDEAAMAPAPTDPLDAMRDSARQLAAQLFWLRSVARNRAAAQNGQPSEPLPDQTPNAGSDAALGAYIGNSLAGATLATLGESMIENVIGALAGMVTKLESQSVQP